MTIFSGKAFRQQNRPRFTLIFSRVETLSHLRSWFKGADTTSVCKYLEERFGRLLQDGAVMNKPYLENIYKSLRAGNQFLSRLYRCHLFLRRPEARHLAEDGRALLNEYLGAAAGAHSRRLCRFKISPKLHLFCHCVLRLEQQAASQHYILSPLSHACQLDEDLVGKLATISRNVAAKTCHERTLRRYLISLRTHLGA